MSQKSRFKMQTQGNCNYRWTFPQLPWGTVKNPTYIQTAHGYQIRCYQRSETDCHPQQSSPHKWLVAVLS